MKPLIILFCLVHGTLIAGQISPPAIQWQRSFGGTGPDHLSEVLVTEDNGYLLAGTSTSQTNGNKTAVLYGLGDFWLLRLDANGNQIWDRTYGGSDDEWLACGAKTDGGGVILGGSSMSPTGGDKTAPYFGGSEFRPLGGDYWLVNVDAFGNKIWDRAFGGTNADYALSVQRTSDGGYILGGNSVSDISGNKTTAQKAPGMNFWILRLDNTGGKVWEKVFGGKGAVLLATEACADGGYLALGRIGWEATEDRTCQPFGMMDFWLVKLDADGNKVWDRAYGGTGDDDPCYILRTSDGGFVLAGYSDSPPSGNKTSPNYGGADVWIVRLNGDCEILWDASFGGSALDNARVVKECPDGGFVIAGKSVSDPGGNKTTVTHGMDSWVVRLNPSGNKLWEQSYGGSDTDYAADIELTPDGGYILVAYSDSPPGGNKTTPSFGQGDFWAIKLGPELPTLRPFAQSPKEIQTNGFRFWLNGVAQEYVIEVSTDFHTWSSLQTNQIATTGVPVEVCDRPPLLTAARFYRAVATGTKPTRRVN